MGSFKVEGKKMNENNLIIEVFCFKKELSDFKNVLDEAKALLISISLKLPQSYREDYIQIASWRLYEIIDEFEFTDLIDELKNIKSKDELKGLNACSQKVSNYLTKEQKCFLKVTCTLLIYERKKYIYENKQWWGVILCSNDELLVSNYQDALEEIIILCYLDESDIELIISMFYLTQKELLKAKKNFSKETFIKT